MQPRKKPVRRKVIDDIDIRKAVYASSVSRFVFKNNRRTVPPEQVIRDAGLMPVDEAGLAEVEKLREKGLTIGRLEDGWEAVHGCLSPIGPALGFYTSVY
ncbi:hypothetical protein BFJ72_g11317 [Fusarium proliferatum]|uniref:Uncharacterized protein n=1 Tax=Gibberella intermedia TaxID=948311 RepID=A0A420SN87_GIBIN|nr:hypothetical protein BFJ72_g11317 [Fusarium proliferatum]